MYRGYTQLYPAGTLARELYDRGRLGGLPFTSPPRRLNLLGMGCSGIVVEMTHVDTGGVYAVKFVYASNMDAELKIHKIAAEAGLAPPLFGGGVVYTVEGGWCAMPMAKIKTERNIHPKHCGALELLVLRLHSLGISHGDIKPSNFLVERGRAYITDFGCSIDHSKGLENQPALLCGDRNYMPPEAVTKGKTAFEIDLYSLQKTLEEIKKL